VYVEKPICVAVDEGPKMVLAARKYKRVVQAGTMQRSAVHFAKAIEIVRSGQLGKVTFVRTWKLRARRAGGLGNPPDAEPPSTLNWDMWLGPAPKHAFNANRFGVDPADKYFSSFRWFWELRRRHDDRLGRTLAGHRAVGFQRAGARVGLGVRRQVLSAGQSRHAGHVTSHLRVSGFIAVYENRENNGQSMFEKGGGILFHGDKGTLFVDRRGYQVIPEKGSTLEASETKSAGSGYREHWANFLECVRTREQPTSDIEKCQHSTTTCLLGKRRVAQQTASRFRRGQVDRRNR